MTSRLQETTPGTRLGPVALVVADLGELQDFYESAIGLRAVERDGDVVRLGVVPGKPLVELVERPGAPPRGRGTTGLFHLALLVPSRAELARAARRVTGAGRRLSGASDHLVSEALYLNDPEGNGIEIYRDRPREEWRYAGEQILMDTLPLDVDGVMAELPPGADAGMPTDTRIGHVHLNVADIGASEAFYHGVLGFDVTVRGYPGALFLSTGGYHHHIGVNTWLSEGGTPPAPGSRGLSRFELVLRSAEELDAVAGRLETAGIAAEAGAAGLLLADPSGNRLLLRV